MTSSIALTSFSSNQPVFDNSQDGDAMLVVRALDEAQNQLLLGVVPGQQPFTSTSNLRSATLKVSATGVGVIGSMHVLSNCRIDGSFDARVGWSNLQGVPNASTTGSGIVQLTDSISSSNMNTAATANAVRQAYDKAAAASNVAFLGTGSLPLAGGKLTGDLKIMSAVNSNNIAAFLNPLGCAFFSSNVGIGTSNASEALTVNGRVTAAKFVGSACNADVATVAAGLTGTPSVTLSNCTVQGALTAAGTVTAAKFVGSACNADVATVAAGLTGSPSITVTNLDVTTSSRLGGAVVLDTFNNTGFMKLTSSAGLNFLQSGLSNATHSAAPLVFATMHTGTEWARFTSNGLFGLGTASPGAKLHVANTGGKKLQFDNDATTNRHIVLHETSNNEHQFFGLGVNSNTFRYQLPHSTASHVVYSATSSNTSSELMRITGTGKVGFRSSTPQFGCEIVDDTDRPVGIYEYNGYAPVIRAFGARGTISSPTTSLAEDCLGGVRAFGYTGTGFGVNGFNNAFIQVNAAENMNSSSNGTYINFGTTSLGTTGTVERMRIAPNGNVGIGTAAPSTALQVNGTVTGTAFSGNGASITSLNVSSVSSGTLAVSYGGTGASSLTASKVLVGNGGSTVLQPSNLHWDNGNSRLGIGTTSPIYTLDVVGSVKGGTTDGVSVSLYNSEIKMRGDNSRHYSIYNSNNTLSIADTSAGSAYGIAGTALIACRGDLGNVGIGTSTPAHKLQVSGSTISLNNTGEARYHLYNNGLNTEWKFGQKNASSHNWVLSSIASATEFDVLSIDKSGNAMIAGNASCATGVFGSKTFTSVQGSVLSAVNSNQTIQASYHGSGTAGRAGIGIVHAAGSTFLTQDSSNNFAVYGTTGAQSFLCGGGWYWQDRSNATKLSLSSAGNLSIEGSLTAGTSRVTKLGVGTYDNTSTGETIQFAAYTGAGIVWKWVTGNYFMGCEDYGANSGSGWYFKLNSTVIAQINPFIEDIGWKINVPLRATGSFTSDALSVLNSSTSSTTSLAAKFGGGQNNTGKILTVYKAFNYEVFNVYADGNAKVRGAFTGNGADYAEYFEWADQNPDDEDRTGLTVVFDGSDKIRVATDTDNPALIFGVISANPSVVGNEAWTHWHEAYLKDEFGRPIYESKQAYVWKDENGNPQLQYVETAAADFVPSDDAVIETIVSEKKNPLYDASKPYVERSKRKEWACVGLVGKLRIRQNQSINPRWIKLRNITETVEEWFIR